MLVPENVELKNIRTIFDFSSGSLLNRPEIIYLNKFSSLSDIFYLEIY